MTLNPQSKTEVGICPGCGARIRFINKVQVGEFVNCDECGDELEVISSSPIKLDWAFEDPFDDEFDGDYDDDFDDDDEEDDDAYEYEDDWED